MPSDQVKNTSISDEILLSKFENALVSCNYLSLLALSYYKGCLTSHDPEIL